MTAKEIFMLRKIGQVEQAYEAARRLYATDKGPYASSAMFWTATDMLMRRMEEGATEEATKICMALERLLPNVPDKNGWVAKAYEDCERTIQKSHTKKAGHDTTPEHLQTGIWGEEVAAEYLRGKGYVILERDWHSGHRDIDIIAQEGDTRVFVEVKTRRNTEFGTPEDAVDWRKRRNLSLAINHYIKYRKIDGPVRFDIITVVGLPGCPHPAIDHIKDVDIMSL